MKNLKVVFSFLLAVGLFATMSTLITSCDDDEPPALTLVSLTAGSIDLNGATSATGVPTGATITAEFSTEVDPASVSAITLERQFDAAAYASTITVDGKTVTINPNTDFSTGTLFILEFGAGLKSTGGKTLTTAIERNFSTEGTFAVPGAVAHWTFEDNANDIIGSYDAAAAQIVDITYAAGRKADAGKAASFNGTTSIIEISNGDQLMNTQNFTLSFWVKATEHTDNVDKGHFVMGLGAFYGFQFEIFGGYGGWKLATRYEFNNAGTINTITEDNAFNGDGKDATNGGWQGFAFTKDLTASGGPSAIIKDKWVHMVYTYNSTTKQGIYYANGEKMRELDFDLWPDGDNKTFITGLKYGGVEPDVKNELAFGFIQSRAGTLWDDEPWGGYAQASANHFKGLLDDVIIYHKVLTAAEVTSMYNSGKP
ncbi:MAG: Ig-like domain-containing protein [Cyclobacteriaceae bacterium]|nr:Ig-like domain-containing protein [Cyclobacteriaceae bacterium]